MGLVTPEETQTQTLATSAFGDLVTTGNHPLEQFKFVNFLPSRSVTFTTGTGGVALNAQSEAEVTSGTTANSVSVFRTKRAMVYRPGEGNMCLLGARFDTGGVADCTQFVGFQSTTDGLGFGYNGTVFGIRHRYGGLRENQSLEITGASSGSENATIFVNGTEYTVPITNLSVQGNAHEIAAYLNANDGLGSYDQVDDKVIYIATLSNVQAGTFSFSSGTATASWTQITAGNAPTDDWIAQADWNVNSMVGLLDPAKTNVYKVQYQYLGGGNPELFIENPTTGKPDTVHMIEWTNKNTRPIFTDPSMPISLVVNSDGSTTDLKVSCSSFAGFRQGEQVVESLGEAVSNLKNFGSGTETNILTVKVSNSAGGRAVHGEILPKLLSVATESSKTTTFNFYVGATLGGESNFQYVNSARSIAMIDTAGTTITGGDRVGGVELNGAGSDDIDIGDLLDHVLSGEQVTIAAEISSGAAADVSAQLSWKENI